MCVCVCVCVCACARARACVCVCVCVCVSFHNHSIPLFSKFLYMTTVKVWQLGGLLDIFFPHNCLARYFSLSQGLAQYFFGICTTPHQLSNGPPLK